MIEIKVCISLSISILVFCTFNRFIIVARVQHLNRALSTKPRGVIRTGGAAPGLTTTDGARVNPGPVGPLVCTYVRACVCPRMGFVNESMYTHVYGVQ